MKLSPIHDCPMMAEHFKETDIFYVCCHVAFRNQTRFLNWEHSLSKTVIDKKVLFLFCSLTVLIILFSGAILWSFTILSTHSHDPDESKIIFFQAANELEKDLIFFLMSGRLIKITFLTVIPS